MSIANELSNEVAVWLLVNRTTPDSPTTTDSDAGNIRRIILELHTTLQRLKREERAARRLSTLLPSGLQRSAANSH